MTIAEQLDQLRQEYRTASPQRREAIKQEAYRLKARACCQCHGRDRLPMEDAYFPFCSQACHEAWAQENDHGSRPESKRPTIAEVRRRLLEMAKEAHLKRSL